MVDANTVSVEISFHCNFVKSTMMKYLIESNTNKEMAKWLDALFAHFKKVWMYRCTDSWINVVNDGSMHVFSVGQFNRSIDG